MSEITEIVYTWPSGREEVRYRRPKDSEGAKKLIDQVECLKARTCGETPYSYRHVSTGAPNDGIPCPECNADNPKEPR